MRSFYLFLLAVLSLAPQGNANAQAANLIQPSAYLAATKETELPAAVKKVLQYERQRPEVTRADVVKVDVAALNATVVRIVSATGRVLEVYKTGMEKRGDSEYSWLGKLADGSHASLFVNGATVYASIHMADGMGIRIQAADKEYHVFSEFDRSKFPGPGMNDSVLPPTRPSPAASSPAPVLSSLATPNIDVLVNYTAAALAVKPSISTVIADEIANLNRSFVDSRIALTARLVGAIAVGGASGAPAIEALRTPGDALDELSGVSTRTGLGYFARSKRDALLADVVVFVGRLDGTPGVGGRGYQGPLSAQWAFAVVDVGNLGDGFSLSHEIGHVIGADHNLEKASPTALTYAHGANRSWLVNFRSTTAPNGWRCFRTIMAYGYSSFQPNMPCRTDFVINYWSDPSISYTDKAPFTTPAEPDQSFTTPIGSASCCHNARVLREYGSQVANFSAIPILATLPILNAMNAINLVLGD